MGHEHEVVIKEEKFEMSAKDKKVALGLLIGGFVLALIGYFTAHAPDHHMVVKRLGQTLLPIAISFSSSVYAPLHSLLLKLLPMPDGIPQ